MMAHHTAAEALQEAAGSLVASGIAWNVVSRIARAMPKPEANASYWIRWLYNAAQEVGANPDQKQQ